MSAPTEPATPAEQPPPPFTEWSGLNLEFETICELRGEDIPHHGLSGVTTIIHERMVFAIGGVHLFSPENAVGTFACLDLNQANPGWTELPLMPYPRNSSEAAVVGGRVVVIGGRLQYNPFQTRTVQCFDIQTRTWTTLMPCLSLHDPHDRSGPISVVNDNEFLMFYRRELGRDQWQTSLAKYNVSGTGSSEFLPFSLRGRVTYAHTVSRNKVVVLIEQTNGRSLTTNEDGSMTMDPISWECSLLDLDADTVTSLPQMIALLLRSDLFCIDSFLFVLMNGTSRMLDLDRLAYDRMGWRDVQSLTFPSLGNSAWMTYLENEKTILAGDLTTAKQLDMSPAFEVGTLKYKSLVSLLSNSQAPDGLIPYGLARGGTVERWHLTYAFAKERPDLFRNTTKRAPVAEGSDNESE